MVKKTQSKSPPKAKTEPQVKENRIITKEEVEKLQVGRARALELMEIHRDQMFHALPAHMQVDRVMGVALTAMTKNPKLLECTQVSVISTILTCCQLGLMMDGILGEAFMVPFKNNQRNTTECQLIIGYKGLTTLAFRSGMVSSVKAIPVFGAGQEDGDVFDYDMGLNEKLEHKRSGLSDPNRITHFYAIVGFLNGGKSFHVMTRKEVEDIRDNAPNWKFAKDKKKTIWYNYFASMGMKTCLRALFKFVPLSTELSRAVAMDELFDAGVNQGLAVQFMNDLKVDAEDISHEIIMDSKIKEEELLEEKKDFAKEKGKSVEEAALKHINIKKPKKMMPK